MAKHRSRSISELTRLIHSGVSDEECVRISGLPVKGIRKLRDIRRKLNRKRQRLYRARRRKLYPTEATSIRRLYEQYNVPVWEIAAAVNRYPNKIREILRLPKAA